MRANENVKMGPRKQTNKIGKKTSFSNLRNWSGSKSFIVKSNKDLQKEESLKGQRRKP